MNESRRLIQRVQSSRQEVSLTRTFFRAAYRSEDASRPLNKPLCRSGGAGVATFRSCTPQRAFFRCWCTGFTLTLSGTGASAARTSHAVWSMIHRSNSVRGGEGTRLIGRKSSERPAKSSLFCGRTCVSSQRRNGPWMAAHCTSMIVFASMICTPICASASSKGNSTTSMSSPSSASPAREPRRESAR